MLSGVCMELILLQSACTEVFRTTGRKGLLCFSRKKILQFVLLIQSFWAYRADFWFLYLSVTVKVLHMENGIQGMLSAGYVEWEESKKLGSKACALKAGVVWHCCVCLRTELLLSWGEFPPGCDVPWKWSALDPALLFCWAAVVSDLSALKWIIFLLLLVFALPSGAGGFQLHFSRVLSVPSTVCHTVCLPG